VSKVEVEVYALSDMNTALGKLDETIRQALEQAQRAVEAEIARLQRAVQRRQQEVARCQSELAYCRSQVDDEGRSPPCTAEQQALREAEASLREAQEQAKRFGDQAGQYQQREARFRQATDGVIRSARVDLEEHIHAGLRYLRSHPSEIGSVPGAGTHGSLYRQARDEWFRRGARGELRTEPRELQGWMRQEVRRGSYYRSPYGGSRGSTSSYHTAHYVAGVDIPENFRWQIARDNIQRMHHARRMGLARTYY